MWALRGRYSGLRRAAQMLEASGSYDEATRLRDLAERLGHIYITVRIPCIQCQDPVELSYRIDEDATPRAVLCGRCSGDLERSAR
jgi:hypothetical protein